MNDGDIQATLTLDNSEFAAALKQAEVGAGKNLRKVGEHVEKTTKQFSALTLGVGKLGLAAVGIGAVVQLAREFAEESEYAGKAIAFVKEQATNIPKVFDSFIREITGTTQGMVDAEAAAKRMEAASKEVAASVSVEVAGLLELRRGLDSVSAGYASLAGDSVKVDAEVVDLAKSLQAAGVSAREWTKIAGELGEDAALQTQFAHMREEAHRAGVSLGVVAGAAAAAKKELESARKATESQAEAYRELEAALGDQRLLLDQLEKLRAGSFLEMNSRSLPNGEEIFVTMRTELEKLGVTAFTVDQALDEVMGEHRLREFEAFARLAGRERGFSSGTMDVFFEGVRAARAKVQEEADKAREALEALNEEARREMPEAFVTGFTAAAKEMRDLERVGADVANGLQSAFQTGFFDFFKERVFDLRSVLGSLLDVGLNSVSALLSGGVVNGLGALLPGFAVGGRPPPGRPVIVGERGPEVANFPPGTEILPNHRLGEVGGGGNVTIHYSPTINAVDAGSFESLLARNPRALVGPLVELFGSNMQLRAAVRATH